jgi:hypothetical protein
MVGGKCFEMSSRNFVKVFFRLGKLTKRQQTTTSETMLRSTPATQKAGVYGSRERDRCSAEERSAGKKV